MFRYPSYAVLLFLFFFTISNAQDISYSQVKRAQQNIHNSIRGTLDGVVKIPQYVENNARQLVFPNALNNGIASNPWSQTPLQPPMNRHRGYNSIPHGNPWAPVGDTQNIPFDQTNITGIEKNPYTDNRPIGQAFNLPQARSYNNGYGAYQGQSMPFNNGFSNRVLDGSNGSFSSPFGNNFFPSNQFWPSGNNGNGSFPFMPW